ncbi:hypothetical protein ASG56_06445 [Rhodococcus sp. Leaf7]|uniref:hypothetical protein n=1 Tax=unclassified Rhodococcus (in: high G+C Gram-positive bacteria) TaxID=192944 RepID=UPI000700C0E7|nr:MULTISPECIES: hypothetical protein [unclassified Rhodococcus (in: high G+C Gram-positive bacteria)]KQU07174.1 hypothetical protein ASG56_06445 [Rhodococcus sp. Leaf7]KQU42692.1 hypothetical protein ASG64_06445 [Rhodococcus sp. Leaf247]
MNDLATNTSAPTVVTSELVDLVVKGMVRGPITPELQAVVDAGDAVAKGPVVMPTQAGIANAGAQVRLPEGGDEAKAVTDLLHVFLPVNRRLRELCTAWQCRPDGSANDHSDAQYDAKIRDQLEDIHTDVTKMLRRTGKQCAPLLDYRERLIGALERFDSGDTASLTSPLTDGYHTVWMWLHQHVLMMLGMTRAQDEALEEKLVSGSAE